VFSFPPSCIQFISWTFVLSQCGSGCYPGFQREKASPRASVELMAITLPDSEYYSGPFANSQSCSVLFSESHQVSDNSPKCHQVQRFCQSLTHLSAFPRLSVYCNPLVLAQVSVGFLVFSIVTVVLRVSPRDLV
ncbi:hypothetical protein H1C71_008005, partial [Ictidomys tridecemlineatus]